MIATGFLIYNYYVNSMEPNQLESISDSAQSRLESSDEGVKKMPGNDKKATVSGAEKILSPSLETFDDSASNNVTARALGIDEDQYQVMKEDYFCDLAITARENCELQSRSEESMELCLKMGGYYTNSRHCGYRP